jgi:riboflavin kinase / FMN adenylyltransferase
MFREYAKQPSPARENFGATATKLFLGTYNGLVKYTGIVQKGSEYARRLGFATANIPLANAEVSGSFVARVRVGEETHGAAVYADQRNKVLEAHILGFQGDLYGKEIEVELIEKIRDDQEFKDEDEAKRVIAGDIAAAEAYFNSH